MDGDSIIPGNLDERLKEAVRIAGGVKAVSAASSVGVSSIYNYMKLEPPPPLAFVYSLCEVAGVRVEWLLTGREPVREPGADVASRVTETVRSAIVDAVSPKAVNRDEVSGATFVASHNLAATVQIRILDVTVSAGGGAVNGDVIRGKSIDFPAVWLSGDADIDHLALLRVAGDSMEPELRSGDWVLVDDRRRDDAGIHVVRRDDHLTVKRIQREGRRLRLISANPLYRDEEIDLSEDQNDFGIIGRVIWSGRWA